MNNVISTKIIAVFLAVIVLCASCASRTSIVSRPSGATVYINGISVGTTPYTHRDTKIVGSSTEIQLEKEGYQTLNTHIERNERVDVGAIIGGIFFIVPFLWTMKYDPVHTYELKPVYQTPLEQPVQTNKTNVQSKTEDLLNLKSLLDKGIITQQEFETEKAKILNEK